MEVNEKPRDVTSRQGTLPSKQNVNEGLEPILQELGSRGRYQTLQIALQLFASFLNTIPSMAVIFIGYQPDYKCNEVENVTQLASYLPADVSIVTVQSVHHQHQCGIDVTVNSSGAANTHTIPCVSGINFSMPSDTSFLTEWSLVCEKAGLTELSQTALFGAQCLSCAVFSPLADRYGRKKVYVTCALGAAAAIITMSFAHDYYMFLACRIVTGFFQPGMVNTAYTMMMELLDQRWRCVASVLDSVMWATASISMAALAYFLQGVSWRYLSLAFSAPFIFSLLVPWFLDESLCWLMATGRMEEAEKILQKACRINGKNFQTVRQILRQSQALHTHSPATKPETSLTANDQVEDRTESDTEIMNKVTVKEKTKGDLRGKREPEIPGIHQRAEDCSARDAVVEGEKYNGETVEEKTKEESYREKDVPEHCQTADERMNSDTTEENTNTGFCGVKDMPGIFHRDGCIDGSRNDGVFFRRGSSVNKLEAEDKDNEPFSARYTVLDLFRHKVVLVPLIVITSVWLTNNLYYYGLMLGSARLSGDRFLNFAILSILDVPSTLVALFLMPRFKRRTLGFFYGFNAAVFLFISVGLVQLGGGQMLTLARVAQYIGKFALMGSYSLLFVYFLEVFPTGMRTAGSGTASGTIRIGNMAAPFLSLWAEKIPWAPGVLVGSLCTGASLSIWFLPETRDRKLPDTIEEVKAWRKYNAL